MADAPAQPEVFGPYLVYERLGSGGMATVHRAIKTGIEGFQRPVALKRLLTQYAGDQEFVRGFVREARLASRLTHPNIAQTYDLGRVDASYYIAMELVEGTDLRHVLRHIAYSVGPMPVALVLGLIAQMCDALDYAHTFADETGRPLGIVHRDVSPSNIIVGRDGVAKIIDFGIAKASTATMHTAAGVLKGKFSYMAPESLDGQTDARSDLFALGVCMWELLTARPLFKGDNDFDTLEQVKRLASPPPSSVNPQVPPAVDHVVLTALTKNPTQRWQNAAHLRQAVAGLAMQHGLRTTQQDLPRWIEWALQQPLKHTPWDDVGPAMQQQDDASLVIEMEMGGTQVGAAPSPRAAQAAVALLPTEASRKATMMAPDGMMSPFAQHAQHAQQPQQHAQPQQPQPAQTIVAWDPRAHAAPAPQAAGYATMLVEPMRPVIGAPVGGAPAPNVANAGGRTQENPLANPEYLAAAAAFNASEEQRHLMGTVISLPEPPPQPKASSAWIVIVLLLCIGAAVGGFFVVQAVL